MNAIINFIKFSLQYKSIFIAWQLTKVTTMLTANNVDFEIEDIR